MDMVAALGSPSRLLAAFAGDSLWYPVFHDRPIGIGLSAGIASVVPQSKYQF